MQGTGWIRSLPETVFGLDTRSLAAFRIAFGMIASLDVLNRVPDLVVHYSDQGALPRAAVLEKLARIEHVSLHMASGTSGWTLFLFGIHLLFAIMMMVGFRTRLATAVVWFLTISLHNRNPLVLHSGDVIIRVMLFWAMFLPLGARWSLDARRPILQPPPPQTYTSIAGLGFIAQIAFVYVFTWALKTGKPWHDGTAVYYTLMIDHFVKQPQANLMLEHLDFLSLLTEATIRFEIIAPALLLFPFFKGPLRTALVFSFWGLHIGFFTFMELGLFPWTCIAAWTAVLPGWFWDRLRVRGTDGPALARPWWREVLALGFLGLVLLWNVSTINTRVTIPEPLATVGRTLRLDQKWEMFAPYPLKDDGWFVVDAQFHDGTHAELLRGGEVSFEKPEGIAQSYAGQRWSKYMRNLWLKKYKDMRLYYGRQLCRTNNAGKRRTDPKALVGFEMWFVKEPTPAPGGTSEILPISIWKHHCYEDATKPVTVESTDEAGDTESR
jgi:hypothetical protein